MKDGELSLDYIFEVCCQCGHFPQAVSATAASSVIPITTVVEERSACKLYEEGAERSL